MGGGIDYLIATIDSVGAAFRNKFEHDASFYVTEIGNGGREV